jgi:hypothetical protein
LRTDATNRKLAPHMGSRATCGTAHLQSLGFNDLATHHANIVGATGREVWSMLHDLETKCSAIARLCDKTGHEDRCAAKHIDGRKGMLDITLLASIAQQMMSDETVDVNGKPVAVRRTSKNHLKTLSFNTEGREYQAIEQNREKPSRWGKLAREGHRVVQFKDSGTNRFVAVSVDGEVMVYGAGHGARKQ